LSSGRGVAVALIAATTLWPVPGRAQGPTQSPTQVAVPAVKPAAVPRNGELVVLVHGMGRTSRSMQPLADALDSAGYDILNVGYSSLCCTVAQLGAAVRHEVEQGRRAEHRVVHFVGHSLGNIIVRWILTQDTVPAGVGRVVMLAPPNQGARSADRYSPLVGWLLEPIDELRTDSTATARAMPRVPDVEIGIIAARDDGKLSVGETHLPEETAHIVVPGTHTFLMRRREVHRLTIAFLRTGGFEIEAPKRP
jgi:triacylglycerol lipase